MSSTPMNQSTSAAPAYLAENPHAGQGPVMLEIGVDTGALIVSAPVELVGREIEIHAFGRAFARADKHPHGIGHDNPHHDAPHAPHAPHVAVIPRPLPNGETATCAVFPDVEPGVYTLWLLPNGPSMPVHVRAGEVTTADWLPAGR